MAVINYPPEEIYKSFKFRKRDSEHIILWMLTNNDHCQWSDFRQAPISFTESTLSKYINLLISKNFIARFVRGKYKITKEGLKRFHEISSTHGEIKRLNYPPEVITRKRNYEDWILWMVYNNSICKWSNFLEPPLAINQSSLSKKINFLLVKELVKRENKEYSITNAGKIEYSKMLKKYDLDRQSILNEESKRIDEITRKTIKFFADYKVDDENIQFRYLETILELDYDRVKSMLTNETDFEKIILYLMLNHPDQFPNYISLKEFANKYGIKQSKLEYYIDEIVDNHIYPIKFFTLNPSPEIIYYFQEYGKVESMLRTITENHITKFTFLNRLFSRDFDAFTIEKEVLEDICGYLFNNALRDSLRIFLPNYIKYLAYKIEAKVELKETYDKLDAIIWQNMIDIFQSRNPKDLKYQFMGQNEINYQVDTVLLELLKPYYIEKIEAWNKDCQQLIDNKDYYKALESIETNLDSYEDDRILLIVKAIVLCYLNRYNDVLALLNDESILSNKDDIIVILSHFLTAFSSLTIGDFNRALDLGNETVWKFPGHAISHATRGLVLAYNYFYKFNSEKAKQDQGLTDLDKAISMDSYKSNTALLFMLKSRVLLESNNFKESVELTDRAISIDPTKVDLYLSKTTILMYFNEYPDLLDLLDEMLDKFPEIEKDLKMKKASVYKLLGDLEAGFNVVEELLEKNPGDKELRSFKAYWYQYMNKKEEALKLLEELIELERDNGEFYDSYGEILMNYEEYAKAVEQFQKAIELSSDGWFIYQSYIKLGICFKELGNFELAVKYLKMGKEYTNKCFCDFDLKKKWLIIADIFLTDMESV
ncbi:MAG: hypothetical protein HWN79_18250 [Candidatus Lokiarchaeota archaeon]|nr:hypothetical protein [Candidatus Lokiarchaeota archaeon]